MYSKNEYGLASKIIVGVLVVNIVCLCLKTYLYAVTLSLAVLAYVIDSVMDFINDVIALYGARIAGRPPDADHSYGHGKYDAFISVFIATVVIVSALEIFRETAERILSGQPTIYLTGEALLIFLALIIIYLVVATVEFYFAKKLRVAVMESSALHYITDPLYTVMVLVSVYLSIKIPIIDAIASTIIGVTILIGGIKIIRKQSTILLDTTAIPQEEIQREILSNFPEILDIHDIKSRSDGIRTYVEFHIVLDGNIPLRKAHELCDRIEDFIRKKYKGPIEITIHVEPYR